MPGESEAVCVEPAPEAQLDSFKLWFYKKAFQGLKIFPQAWGIRSTQKINDMSYSQLISGPSAYVKKRSQRSEASILLRHMDDAVGTGPDEHLMSDFEHIKTSLCLTDVVESLLNLYGLENLKPTANPGESLRVGKLATDSESRKTFDSDGARVSNFSGWS